MSRCEQITQWRQLIASYQRHCHQFDDFCLYALFDTRENAIASQLVYSPRQWIHPQRGLVQDHLCVNRLPASSWRVKKNQLGNPVNAAHLHEAQAFSSLLFTRSITNQQNKEPDDYLALPDILRSFLPPRGVISIKLEGIKHCREFVLDYLAMLDDDNGDDFIWSRYCHDARYYVFNWREKTKEALYHVLPASYKSRVSVFWLPRSQIFVASLRESIPMRVLRYCIDFLKHHGEWDLVNALKEKMTALPLWPNDGMTPASNTNEHYRQQVTDDMPQTIAKKGAISSVYNHPKGPSIWRADPLLDQQNSYLHGGWFGVCVYDSVG